MVLEAALSPIQILGVKILLYLDHLLTLSKVVEDTESILTHTVLGFQGFIEHFFFM